MYMEVKLLIQVCDLHSRTEHIKGVATLEGTMPKSLCGLGSKFLLIVF